MLAHFCSSKMRETGLTLDSVACQLAGNNHPLASHENNIITTELMVLSHGCCWATVIPDQAVSWGYTHPTQTEELPRCKPVAVGVIEFVLFSSSFKVQVQFSGVAWQQTVVE